MNENIDWEESTARVDPTNAERNIRRIHSTNSTSTPKHGLAPLHAGTGASGNAAILKGTVVDRHFDAIRTHDQTEESLELLLDSAWHVLTYATRLYGIHTQTIPVAAPSPKFGIRMGESKPEPESKVGTTYSVIDLQPRDSDTLKSESKKSGIGAA